MTTDPSPMTTAAVPAELLSIEQAAQRIGMSPRYVRRLVAERRIRFYRLGRCVRLDPADLAAHIASGRTEPLTASTVYNDLRSVA